MQEKRQAILDTALKLFVEQGFHATPTAQIAKEAEVATGTLFHYFSTKEELINTLYLETKVVLIEEVSRDVNEQTTIKAKLKQIFLNAINWALRYPEHQIFYTQFSHSPFISQITKELGEQRLQFVYDIIEEGKKTDVLKNIPTDLLFEASLSLMNGIIKHLMENPEKLEDTAYMNQAYSLFWDSMRG